MNNKLNFALIGAGKFGKNYIRLLQETEGVLLKSIVVKSKKSAQELSKLVPPQIKITTNIRDVLNDKKISGVIIATPPATHFGLIKLALQHNKHILVEKPMVINLAQARALKKLLKNYKPVFMVGYQYMYNDYINYILKKIKSGYFGKIYFVLGEHLKSPTRDDVDSFMDAGCHHLSLVQYLFGTKKIKNISGGFASLAKNKIDDFASVNFKIDHGITVNIITSWLGPEKTRKLTIVGEKNIAVLDETLIGNKVKLFSIADNLIDNALKIKAREPLKMEFRHFIQCIKNNKKPTTDFNFGFSVNQLLDKITRAIKN